MKIRDLTNERLQNQPRTFACVLFFSIILLVGLNNLQVFGAATLDLSFNASVDDGNASVDTSLVQPDGKILISGNFARIETTVRRGIARLNADGSLDTSFNPGSGINGTVLDFQMQTDGKILAVGSFTQYNGTTVNRIARLNSDGTLDNTFNIGTGTNNSINDIVALTSGKLLIGGVFTTYNGATVSRIARLNADGGLDNTFSTGTINSQIEQIAVQTDDKIVIGGNFTTVAGNTRNRIARLNSDGTFDAGFNAAPLSISSTVLALAIQANGKILVGGAFEVIVNQISYRSIFRLNTDGTFDDTFQNDLPRTATTNQIIIQPDGKILAAGIYPQFSNSNFAVVRFNPTGGFDPNFFQSSSVEFAVRSMSLLSNNEIFLGGEFYQFGDLPGIRKRMVKLASNGDINPNFSTVVESFGEVLDIYQQSDGKILVGGMFHRANGVSKNNIVRFNQDGSIDNTFNIGAGADARVAAIDVQTDGKILIGGQFFNYNNAPIHGIARLNQDGSLDNSLVNAENLQIIKIKALPDGKILAGGFFTIDPENFINSGIIRMKNDGSLDSSFNSITGPGLRAATDIEPQPDGKILIGGNFTTYNGTTRNRLARLLANGDDDTTFNTSVGTNGVVNDLALLPDGKILVSGTLTTYNGVLNPSIIRINSDSSADSLFSSGTGTVVNGVAGQIGTMSPQPTGKILIGGDFSVYNGTPINDLAQLNNNGSLDPTFGGLTSIYATAVRKIIRQSDGKILVGGLFDGYNGVSRLSIMRLNAPQNRAALFDYDGDGKSDISTFRPSDGVWYLNQSTAGFGAVNFGLSADIITPADYDGDGKTDIAVFRDGIWYLLRSQAGFGQLQFGLPGDVPVPADYDGDGKAEIAVYRAGTWYSFNLANGQVGINQFGLSTDKPVVADYDGDGKADQAVYRGNGEWHLNRSTQGYGVAQFGLSTDKPVVGDYDGDGKADEAVYRNGTWYVLQSTNGFTAFQWGVSTDLPAPADYDGDGKTDAAIYRNGVWYLLQSTSGISIQQFGLSNDKPTPGAFLP